MDAIAIAIAGPRSERTCKFHSETEKNRQIEFSYLSACVRFVSDVRCTIPHNTLIYESGFIFIGLRSSVFVRPLLCELRMHTINGFSTDNITRIHLGAN